MAQLRDLLVNGQSRYLGPAMFNDILDVVNGQVKGDLLPLASSIYSLGSEALKWKNIYADIIYGSFVGTLTGNVTGNANTASALKTAVKINGTDFDGSANITTANWGTARTISIDSKAGTTGTSVNGSKNYSLIIPSTMTGFTSITSTTFIGNLTGTATSAVKATKDGDDNVITATYAPKNHASTADTYGLGSSSNYGHVKLSDAKDSTSGASSGIAATPKAVKLAYDLAASKISLDTHQIELNSKGSLASYGGFIDFHFHNADKKPLNASGEIVDATPDYTSRIIENAAGQLNINGLTIKNSIATGAFVGTLTGNVVGNATSATTATYIATDKGTTDSARHVFFAYDGDAIGKQRVVADDDFKYNPSTNTLYAVGLEGKKIVLKDTVTAGNGITMYRTNGADEALKINVDANNGTITNTNETQQSVLNLVLEYKDTANSGAKAGSKTIEFKATSGGSQITATTFVGALSGNATSATKATKDGDGNIISSTYLKLSGGTMTGNIVFPSNAGIVQHQNTTSNYTVPIKWLQGGVSEGAYDPQIGHHNTGNTDGAIILLPYSTDASPWNGNDGLYIGKTVLKWNGYSVLNTKDTVTTAQGGTGNTSYTANRLVWTETATKFTAGYHYANASKIGVNYTSEPSYNLYVNGTSYLNGTAAVNGTLTVTSNIIGQAIVNAAKGIGVNSNAGTGAGISLYNGVTADTAPTYGLMFAKTNSFGTHGNVTGDWATYFTMSDSTNRGWIFRSGTNNVASIASNGVGTFKGVGNGNTYIQHPLGGEHTGAAKETGYLTITLPVKFTNTMVKFKVSIYSYATGTSVEYIIGGYNYNTNATWYHPTAICIGKKGAIHSNHPVTFGQNADGYAQIQIGSNGTVWEYPNINITDITLGHNRTYADWQKAWTISFTTTAQTATQTVTNTYVGYNAQNSDYATKADYLQVSSTSKRDSGFYYYKGQPTIGTAEGNAHSGSSGTLALWSYPPNSGTSVNTSNNTVNVQIARFMWGGTYWSELFFSPNNQDIWTRSVQNGSPKDWRKIIDTGNLPNYINGTVNKVAKFTGANSVGNSNITDDGSTITLGTKVIVKCTGSSFNEGIRIIPGSNGWSNIFFSKDTSESGSHVGGWLIGRRGQAGTYGAAGDFTIEDANSTGKGLTLHQNNGGATLFGTFNVIGKVRAQSTGSTWISGKTITNASYSVSTKQTSNQYHPAFAITSSSSNVWNIGGLGDNIGIYGYYAARTENGTDFSTVWNTSTGHLTHNKSMTVDGDFSAAGMVATKMGESVKAGTTNTTKRNSLIIYGQTYGNSGAADIKVAGRFSWGDPGPQIIFGTDTNLAASQKIALIYTDHDSIFTGNSLSLVSTEGNAAFIAPTIKAINGLQGTLTGNVVGNVTGTTTRIALNGISNDTTYGDYGGIIQSSSGGPNEGTWHNSIKILHNNSQGYYTQLAQQFTGDAGLWHRRNVAGTVSDWVKILDSNNYTTTTDTRYVKKSGDTMTGTLYINCTSDVAAASYTPPGLVIGVNTGEHLELDGNEIMAKSSKTAATTLHLNAEGGLVQIGSGGLSVNGSATIGSSLNVTGNSTFTGTTTHNGAINMNAGMNWKPGTNITCTPTANNQEFSIDVGKSGITGTFWHVWSATKSASILACFSDDLSVRAYGAMTIGGALSVSGASTLSSTLTVAGATTLSSTLGVAGVATFQSSAVVNGAFTAKGNVTLGDATSDVHKVNGNTTFNGTVYLANGTTYKLDNSGNANLKVANAEALQLDNKVKFVYNSTDKCVDVIFM